MHQPSLHYFSLNNVRSEDVVIDDMKRWVAAVNPIIQDFVKYSSPPLSTILLLCIKNLSCAGTTLTRSWSIKARGVICTCFAIIRAFLISLARRRSAQALLHILNYLMPLRM
jgi:hypothetical protein